MLLPVAVMVTVTSTVKRRSNENSAWLLSCGEGREMDMTQTDRCRQAAVPVASICRAPDTKPS